jgi:hypothetical protein
MGWAVKKAVQHRMAVDADYPKSRSPNTHPADYHRNIAQAWQALALTIHAIHCETHSRTISH